MTRLAVLDLDGTLLDTLDDLAASVNAALAAVGRPPRRGPRSSGSSARGRATCWPAPWRPGTTCWSRPWRPGGPTTGPTAWSPPAPSPASPSCSPAPGAGWPSTPTSRARWPARSWPAWGCWIASPSSPAATRPLASPSPAGTLEIMRRLGARARDTVFIGDSPTDVRTARAAGVTLVGVTLGLPARGRAARGRGGPVVDTVAGLAPWLA